MDSIWNSDHISSKYYPNAILITINITMKNPIIMNNPIKLIRQYNYHHPALLILIYNHRYTIHEWMIE